MTERPPANGTECVVALRGEIDLVNAPNVLTAAQEAINACPADADRIVIDLSEVTFLDSSGIGALIDVRNIGVVRGVPTLLRGVPSSIARVLEISGLTSTFESPAV